MDQTVTQHEFQGDAKQILDLMVHSVYSNKEVFLRELISNASDALDKLRFEALQNSELNGLTDDLHIRIETDKNERTLTVHDNGIGMNRDELVHYLGTIAKSGSKEYLALLKSGEIKDLPPELIGQFGVGFYSSFMVADKVRVVTRRAEQHAAWQWESRGDGTYTIAEAHRESPGTSITLSLKDSDEEDGLEDYTQEYVIRRLVRHYSDFVAYPIRMKVERREVERDKDGKPKEGGKEKTVLEDETLNSMKAIWTRPESDVEDSEYEEFYKHISHDWTPPLKRVAYKAEGIQEFRALLFIPKTAPFDLFMREAQHGIHLYVRRVFIMQDCKDLLPEYLRFVRGVVDSEDLSLNISREILQKNRQIQAIRKAVTRKLLDALQQMLRTDKDEYIGFWKEFGTVLKEGLFQDLRNRDHLLDLALFRTTRETEDTPESEKWRTIEDYIADMPEGQEAVYYLTGKSLETLTDSPQLEAFRQQGVEVLLLPDQVDEIWTQNIGEYKEKKFLSVAQGAPDLGSEEEKKKHEEQREELQKSYKPLIESLKQKLDDYVKDVRVSSRLTASPVCLVGDTGDPSPQIEALLRAAGRGDFKVKRILEINPKHEVLEKLRAVFEADAKDPRIEDYARLLYGQALLADGHLPPDPNEFSRRMADLMSRAL